MPNWCYNRLEVSGPAETVTDFQKATVTDTGSLSFHALVPMPESVRTAPGDAWYKWSVDNWGTKWDLRDEPTDFVVTDIAADGTCTLSTDFSTAWAPPVAWCEKVAAKYPALIFRLYFDEPGMSVAGLDIFRDGIYDRANSWDAESMSWINCAAPDCDNYDEPIASYMPWDFDGKPNEQQVREVYCSDHQLIKVVVQQVRSDEAAGLTT